MDTEVDRLMRDVASKMASSGSASESPASGPKPRLLIAYDGSDLAAAAVRSAAELFPGSAALVVTVWERGLGAMPAVNPGLDAAGIAPVQLDPELVSELDVAGEQHAAVVAREGAQLAGSLGLDAQPHAIPDEVHVADTIVELAIERDAAAVVVGSHGISGLRSRLLGSTSRQVLKRCRCPVVVIRAPENR
jgi:nucleotide-binding universal stress UspA family protein